MVIPTFSGERSRILDGIYWQFAGAYERKRDISSKIGKRVRDKPQKAVPILTKVVEEMHTLEPKEQNDLLKMIIDRIEYEKTESGAAIEPTLRISLKI